jgi:hypothetical protein
MIQGIGTDVLNKMKQLGDELISAHIDKIKSAYNHSDDQKLSVSLSFSLLAGEKPGDYDVEAQIGYIVEKVKEKIKATVSQTAELFPPEESKPYILTKHHKEGEEV